MKSDFSRLYSLLGIEPGCSLEEFKRAYRRRIAELHPDRAMAVGRNGEASPALNDLNSIYDTAMRFHKQHGRLPGAMPGAPRAAAAPMPAPAPAAETAQPAAAAPVAPQRTDSDTAPPGRKHNARLTFVLLLLLATLLGFLLWEPLTQQAGGTSLATGTSAQGEQADAMAAMASHLELGMDKESVIAVQGNPVGVRGEEWYYGPSWLRFEDNRLVDWYNSPLYRLKTGSTSTSPQPATE